MHPRLFLIPGGSFQYFVTKYVWYLLYFFADNIDQIKGIPFCFLKKLIDFER